MRLARRSAVVAVVSATAVAATAGTALAYYAVTISPTTASASIQDGTVTLEATAVAGDALYPGGPAADVTVTVRNPFPVEVTVDSISATATGCTTPDLVVTQPAGLPLTVPAGGSTTRRLAGVVRIGTASSSNCQGRVLTVDYTVSGRL